MIYLELILGFLEVGCFSFGGAYSAIPLIRDVVLSYGWLSDETMTYMIAVAESTPGPIMVNLATFVGNAQGGLLGAILATTAVVLPSFFAILLIMNLLRNLLKYGSVQAILRGLKPCIIGIVLATGAYMTLHRCFPVARGIVADWRALVITGLLLILRALYPQLRRKKLSPIAIIVISAIFGLLIY